MIELQTVVGEGNLAASVENCERQPAGYLNMSTEIFTPNALLIMGLILAFVGILAYFGLRKPRI